MARTFRVGERLRPCDIGDSSAFPSSSACNPKGRGGRKIRGGALALPALTLLSVPLVVPLCPAGITKEGVLDGSSTFPNGDLRSGVLLQGFSTSFPVMLSLEHFATAASALRSSAAVASALRPLAADTSALRPFAGDVPVLRPAEACCTNANCRPSSDTCVARSAACCISDLRQSRSTRNASSAASRASSASSQKTLASASRLTASATSLETAAGTMGCCTATATSSGFGSCNTSCLSTALASGESISAGRPCSASKRLSRRSSFATLRTS